MKALYSVALVAVLLAGCASNSNQSIDNSQTLASNNDDIKQVHTELANPIFGSPRFFQAFAESATESVNDAYREYKDPTAVADYVQYRIQQDGQPAEVSEGFLGLEWGEFGEGALDRHFIDGGIDTEWEFIDSYVSDGYTDSYYAVHAQQGIEYINIVWQNATPAIVDLHKIIYRFSLFDSFIGVDRFMESEQYEMSQRAYFIHAYKALNKGDLQQFKIRYEGLPEELRQHPLLVDKLVRWAVLDDSGQWKQMIRKVAVKAEPHSQFYNYYLLTNQTEKALAALDTLPPTIQEYGGVNVERAVLYYELNELDRAALLVNQAILSDPYLVLPYYVKLMVALKRDDQKSVLLTLEVLKARFNVEYDKESFLEIDDAEGFLSSSYAAHYFG
ncbi:hypothetical protein [Corallincola holothuriorum]|nr:hypothetical protein [Corallincola holothuriorum]